MKLAKIFSWALCVFPALTLGAQEAFQRGWESHAGIGMSIGASGLPSQMANEVAKTDKFLSNISQQQGLPIGATLFFGLGYKVSEVSSFGVESSLGFTSDGGKARVTMGQNLPGYAIDGANDSAPTLGGGPAFFGDMNANVISSMQRIYNQLSTVNTMKGQFIDPRFRVYYRFKKADWSLQGGAGLALLIPFGYYAYPSKDYDDYDVPNGGSEGSKNPGWDEVWSGGATQIPLKPAHVPFPLRTLDGAFLMQAVQPLFDFNFRASLTDYFVEVAYATEFKYIHNLKISLGIAVGQTGASRQADTDEEAL